MSRAPGHAGILPIAALIVAATAAPSAAQFSPGPLSRPHADLEGTLQCMKCHSMKRKEPLNDRCLACHAGIAKLIDAGRGLHGEEAVDEACAACHPEHAGEDFALIAEEMLDPERFDHRRAGWELRGKHAELVCGKCHDPRFLLSPLRAGLLSKGGSRRWIGLEEDCAACHEDPHANRLGPRCADCHVETGFHDVERKSFDHGRTGWELRGAHVGVDCARCHDPEAAWGPRPAHDRCASCHPDPHGGRAIVAGTAVDCSACHDESAFRPSTYTVVMHAGAPYALEGEHRQVGCEQCHVRSERDSRHDRLTDAGVMLRRDHALCGDCHLDAHAGQVATRLSGGECGECHTVFGWKPSTFTAASHEESGFPLEGGHAATPCSACHAVARTGLPPLASGRALGAAGVALRIDERLCRDCHFDPHAGLRAARPAAGAEIDASVEHGCDRCHDTDRFRPSRLGVADHGELGFPLRGAHRAVPCLDCHPDFTGEELPSTLVLAEPKGRAIGFRRERTDCAGCHDDPHRGRLAEDCAKCHDEERFRPASRFDHDRDSIFPLSGGHRKVPCASCHPSTEAGEDGAFVLYKPVDPKCESCHGDRVIGSSEGGSSRPDREER